MNAPLLPKVMVDGEEIPAARISDEAQMHPAPKGKPGLAWRAAARALVVRKLLLNEARRQGVSAEPTELTPGRFETEDEALIRVLLDQSLSPVQPDAEAVRAEWARDPERFRTPPLWEASHILISAEGNEARAHERAEALAALLRDNPARFEDLARSESGCSSAAQGGMLGQLRPGDCVPEFEAALRGLAPGQITPEPVHSRFGWHLIRLDALAEARVLPFEAVRAGLSEAMEKAAWAKAARDYVAGLAAKAEIEGVDLEA